MPFLLRPFSRYREISISRYFEGKREQAGQLVCWSTGLLVSREAFDKADKEVEVEGAPAAGIEVVIRKGHFPTIIGGLFQIIFRPLVFWYNGEIECAARFTDRAVGLEVREAVNTGMQVGTERLEPPCVLECLALRERCPAQDDGVLFLEIISGAHQSAQFL